MSILAAIKGVSAAKKTGMGAGALILIGLIGLGISQFIDRAFDEAEEKGAARAINAGQQTTIKQAGDAHAAEQKIDRNIGNARYDECLRSARTPGNCERYRTDRPVRD